MGYVFSEFTDKEEGFAIEIIGENYAARRLQQVLFDPDGTRLRA